MRRVFRLIPIFAVLILIAVTPSVSDAAEQILNGHRFTIPDGLVVELVAGPPLIERPITMDFDEQGRLYVADSSGSNEPAQKQLEERPHRIIQLRDQNGDGQFDTRTVFADQMMFPEGTLWYDGSLYVSAPPVIWKLTDTNDDGTCDRREVWFDGKTLTGCANDLHGPYLGLDGWIYWCKGAFAEQTYERPGKDPLKSRAAHIFRRRADGSGPIESVMTGGMDNPVDVVFTPGGERLFTTTFLQNPGGGLRDGVIHAVHGGVYGKVHNVTDYHPRTGDLMPPLIHMGAAAPCGLHRYESKALGAHYEDNLFTCQFNMHKVSRHQLTSHGATFLSVDSDLIVSDQIDFHPTDVLEDADGSVIVCDTGGWYKLCCPTSQLAKPDVLGALYRIRRRDFVPVADPRGLKINWKAATRDLTRWLGDPRIPVQKRAIATMATRPDAVVELQSVLASPAQPPLEHQRRNAVWTLTRIDSPAARQAVRDALRDPSDIVRQIALQSISLWRDAQAAPSVREVLQSGTPQQQRLAAEILGRLEDPAAVAPLLEAAARLSGTDRVLEHGIVYALIEIADPASTAAALRKSTPGGLRAALLALDQMPGGRVEPEQVVPLLTIAQPQVREVALWLAARHPEWGPAVAGYLRGRLAATLTADEQQELAALLGHFASAPEIQGLLADGAAGSPGVSQVICLTVMQKAGLKLLPDVWSEPLLRLLSAETDVAARAVAVVRAIAPSAAHQEQFAAALQTLSQSETRPVELRIEAAAAQPPGRPLDDALLNLVLKNLAADTPVATRASAVEALIRSRLSVDQSLRVADSIAWVGPLELIRLLSIFEAATDESVGMKLVGSLAHSAVLTSLRADTLKQKIGKFPPSVQKAAEPLYGVINAEAARQKERLDQVLTELMPGDIRRGQLVFQNSKAACSACHAIGYLGGTIGPDLSRIGKIRTERDLLESLLFPSVSFVRSYEPILIVTTAGKSFSGLIRRETPEEIVLTVGVREEVRIPRREIDEVLPGTVSIMPAGLETQLTPQQLADLIAFLKSRQ